MYIRKTKSRKSTCFQIGEKIAGKFVIRKHIGCSSNSAEIEALHLKAKQVLYEWQHANQIQLFDTGVKQPKAKLTQWKITGYHKVFGKVYDLIGFPDTMLRDLVIARIVYPKSKSATLRYLSRYLGINIQKNTLFRFLDTIDKNELTKIAFDFVSNGNENGISVCFYDVTTLYFETTKEDELRNKGFSKDHRTDIPQILVGLFVDSQGYPFDFDFYNGNTFEGHTFIKAVKSIRKKYSFNSLTIVADAGMLSQDNLKYLDSIKVNYIVGARLKNLSQEVTSQVLAHEFSKKPIYQTIIKNQKLIVDYSVGRAKIDAKNRNHLVSQLKNKISKGKAVIRKSKYVLTEGSSNVSGIDEEKIKDDEQFDGLKGYLTNKENKDTNTEIINQYHQLWQVEKAFRMSKHDLRERPIYHYQPDRIKAHLVLCFVSLLVMRESERYMSKIGCTLDQSIELLGKVGQGIVQVGGIELITESENEMTTQMILDLFEGH